MSKASSHSASILVMGILRQEGREGKDVCAGSHGTRRVVGVDQLLELHGGQPLTPLHQRRRSPLPPPSICGPAMACSHAWYRSIAATSPMLCRTASVVTICARSAARRSSDRWLFPSTWTAGLAAKATPVKPERQEGPPLRKGGPLISLIIQAQARRRLSKASPQGFYIVPLLASQSWLLRQFRIHCFLGKWQLHCRLLRMPTESQ